MRRTLNRYPKRPQKRDMEKIAQTIVIEVRKSGSDPYDALMDTGYQGNLMDSLLKKYNIFNQLDSYEGECGDVRDGGPEPLKLDILHERMGGGNTDCGCGSEVESYEQPTDDFDEEDAIKKRTQDLNSMKSMDLGPKKQKSDIPKEPDFSPKEEDKEDDKGEEEEKTASEQSLDILEELKKWPVHIIVSRCREAKIAMRTKAAEVSGLFKVYAEKLAADHEGGEWDEMGRLYPESQVVQMVYKEANRDLPTCALEYKVAMYNDVEQKVATLQTAYDELVKMCRYSNNLDNYADYRKSLGE